MYLSTLLRDIYEHYMDVGGRKLLLVRSDYSYWSAQISEHKMCDVPNPPTIPPYVYFKMPHFMYCTMYMNKTGVEIVQL